MILNAVLSFWPQAFGGGLHLRLLKLGQVIETWDELAAERMMSRCIFGVGMDWGEMVREGLFVGAELLGRWMVVDPPIRGLLWAEFVSF